jgi:hypothetical protein
MTWRAGPNIFGIFQKFIKIPAVAYSKDLSEKPNSLAKNEKKSKSF